MKIDNEDERAIQEILIPDPILRNSRPNQLSQDG